MTTRLCLAPAAAGKTAAILARARGAGRDLAATPRVVVPTHLQARAARHRLAHMGGAIGVRVLTFDRLYAEILNAAGEIYVELSEPVQYRLIRAIVDGLPLIHYAPLADRPGFIQVLQRLIGELKAARVHPDAFAAAVRALGDEPRLAELAQIYATYQARLQAQGWADRAGLGWLAVEALEQRAADVGRDWPLLAVDGFDSFTPIQLALLRALAGRVGELIVTLTGAPDDRWPGLAHRRFARTRAALEAALSVQAEPLPTIDVGTAGSTLDPRAPALAHLTNHLFRPDVAAVDAGAAVALIEAAGREAEVRAALRWLKQRIVLDGCRPAEVALLARNVAPYRPFIQQIAAEFGLPIRLVDGLPLRENPAVAALLGLLQVALPDPAGGLSLSRRGVIEAWRSPYFDWPALARLAPAGAGARIEPDDADDLDAVGRWGRVIAGEAQWAEAFDRLAELTGTPSEDEERGTPVGLPRGEAARTLRAKFERFVARITPPDGARPYREFVGWLEALIGGDTLPSPGRRGVGGEVEEPASLQVVARARAGDALTAERDIAALAGLKDVLRGLVWAEEALGTPAVDFGRFVAELTGALDAASYHLPVHPDREEILVADVVQARGLPFRAVAVLGLAEGEFPATLSEDPFLRDADRRRLRDEFGLPLELTTESAEAEFFYETVARPAGWLLLTRPRLADNGAPWQASPYWEAMRRLVTVEPVRLTGESAPRPDEAASWPELLESLAVHRGQAALRRWAGQAEPTRLDALDAALRVLQARWPAAGSDPFDGDLTALADTFAGRFGPEHVWSASRLEAYRGCPFAFFVGHVLELEPRPEPVEGLDARQLGNIYHRIFEQLYRAVHDPADLDELLEVLPIVAGAVLDDAPRVEGFRVTAWWQQSRGEIVANVRRSVEALAGLPGGFVPIAQEAAFNDDNSLIVTDGDDAFRLHGVIDRVDRAPDGSLRIIDYKTGGPNSFTQRAVAEGKKLQLPLYALAAGQALGPGPAPNVVEGFYWHVQHAKASEFTLSGFDGGPQAAIQIALAHAWSAVRGARAGQFTPHPPAEGCPDYCPAIGFCWRYRPRW
jgi:ATP-dependent helicase/nuclease subunit B